MPVIEELVDKPHGKSRLTIPIEWIMTWVLTVGFNQEVQGSTLKSVNHRLSAHFSHMCQPTGLHPGKHNRTQICQYSQICHHTPLPTTPHHLTQLIRHSPNSRSRMPTNLLWEHTRIENPQSTYPVHAALRIDDTSLRRRSHARGSHGVIQRECFLFQPFGEVLVGDSLDVAA